ncbi:MAG: glycosyltransferase, partial [Candidatus Jettenia sp.]|nr:glycosyltransferase [Candidatus Jettenia sp.]
MKYRKVRILLYILKEFLSSPKQSLKKFIRKYREVHYRLDFLAEEKGLKGNFAILFLYLRHHSLFPLKKNIFNYNEQQLNDQYREWIEKVEFAAKKLSYKDSARDIKGLTNRPLVSILMPVFNTDEIFLRKALFSVINQTYPNWELCIVDDCSTRKIIPKILAEFAKRDSRIKIQTAKSNLGISLATNAAAKMAKGEFLAMFDHDDLLEPDALLEVVKALIQAPDTDYIYTDDDKIDMFGNRFHPQFKPDWDPELLLSYCYISHFRVIRKSIFDKLGGHDPKFDGTQDFELAL